MDRVPLIPKSNEKGNCNTSHIVREVFQEFFNENVYPDNTLESINKHDHENATLKQTATTVAIIYNEAKLSIVDVNITEEKIMCGHGKFLIVDDIIKNDEHLTETIRLKRMEIFEDLTKIEVEKFGLVERQDLLPSKPEQSMDFRINSNRHLCALPCPQPIPSDLDVVPSKLQLSSCGRKRKLKTKKISPSEVVFKPYPRKLIFYNYELDKVYEKKIMLRNETKVTRSFVPPILPKGSFFKLELISKTTRIAPGMSAVFLVKFQTDTYKDVQDVVKFKTYTPFDAEAKLTLNNIGHQVEPEDGSQIFDFNRSIAVNSTIDCGSCLLGNRINLTVVLKNEGGNGHFFLMSEDEWYLCDVENVNTSMQLTGGPFDIQPSYFKIEEEEFVEVSLEFFPLEYGLHIEKIYLLCDNNTFEELEIIGDGIIFEKDFLKVDTPKKLKKPSSDEEAEYYLNFGNCLPYSETTLKITVENNSPLDLSYYWKIRKSYSFAENTCMELMDPRWIEIGRVVDHLEADTTTEFDVILQSYTHELGLYSLVAMLYIKDIPEESLGENTDFLVEEKSKTSQTDILEPKYLDVIVAEIEIACTIVPIHIMINPAQLLVPITMHYQKTMNQKVQLRTNGDFALRCKWKLINKQNHKRCCVLVNPIQFILEPQEVFFCEIAIKAHDYDDIHEKLILDVNEGTFKKEYNIIAKVEKPNAKLSKNLIDFGYIAKGRRASDTFDVENLGQEEIQWEILEFTYDFNLKKITQINDSHNLSIKTGILQKFGDKCTVIYSVNSEENHRWFSFLTVISVHPSNLAMNSLCLITYEICQPNVIIHTPSSRCSILYPGKLLYLGTPSYHPICLHNVSNLPGCFIWGVPVGAQAKSARIKFSPRSGIIQPGMCYHIKVELTPLELGILEEMYIPCFVGRMDDPIILTVLCVTENICVNFHLPIDQCNFEKQFWPPRVPSELETIGSFYDICEGEQDSQFDLLHQDESRSPKQIAKDYWKIRKRLGLKSPGSGSSPKESIDSVGTASIHSIFIETGEEQLDENEESEQSWKSFDESSINIQSSLERSTMKIPDIPLNSYFGSELLLQKHVIEFRRVPLRTPVKKTIIIENLTPIIGYFTAEAINFHRINENDEKNHIDQVFIKMKLKKSSEWEDMINPCYGIVVKPAPEFNKLPALESVEVDLWVYANTWGVYAEEIVIDIDDIQPFCFTLLIGAVGVPIEFPIALNAGEAILRFGTVAYLSNPSKRKMLISNFSSIPLCIVWHTFVPEFKSAKKNLPFNVIFDVFPATSTGGDWSEQTNTSTEGLMMLTENYGHEDPQLFEIQPREANINAKSIRTIEITMNPKNYNAQYSPTQIDAYLIGHIHLSEELKYEPHIFCRPTGIDILPVQAKLLATIELPLLKIEYVWGDVKIKAYAHDIIVAGSAYFKRHLLFKNPDKAVAVVSMHSLSPFTVLELKTAETTILTTAAEVRSNQCVEVFVECSITAQNIIELSGILYNENVTNFSEVLDAENNAIVIERSLNIHQRGLLEQTIPLQLVIYYSELKVAPLIVKFGVMFVGNSKKMDIHLMNYSSANVPFEIVKATELIIARPVTGVVPKGHPSAPGIISVDLYFYPNESKDYREVIRVGTNIPHQFIDVTCTCTGTHNEKFYIDGM